jgi:hypothetical protein
MREEERSGGEIEVEQRSDVNPSSVDELARQGQRDDRRQKPKCWKIY